jgi:branched-chain amino acid transport system permease protein
MDRGRLATTALLLAAAVFLLVGSLMSTNFATFTVNGVALGMVYGGLALALVLIYQATHVINFAQGELAMFTTYIAWQLTQWGFSFWLAFATTLAIAFVLGAGLQVTLIRPVQHRSVVATVIVTVGLFIVIDGVTNWIWGSVDYAILPNPFGFADTYDVGGVLIRKLNVGMVGVLSVSLLAVWAMFRFTKLGLAMRAAALRPASAALAGVRVDAMLAIGWGLAAVIGAAAGMMDGLSELALQPVFMLPILVFSFAAAALGGLESPVGAVVGGLAIGIFLQLIVGYVPEIDSNLTLPFSFAVLLTVLLIKPSGLFGRKETQRV